MGPALCMSMGPSGGGSSGSSRSSRTNWGFFEGRGVPADRLPHLWAIEESRRTETRERGAWGLARGEGGCALQLRPKPQHPVQMPPLVQDEQFPAPQDWIESPAARENRIAELARTMKLSAFAVRTWELERTKEETMLKPNREVARQPEQHQQPTRDPGPTRDYYGPSP